MCNPTTPNYCNNTALVTQWCPINHCYTSPKLCCILFKKHKTQFVSLIYIGIAQVLEILPCRRQGLVHPTKSIPWLLMSWRRKEPGHQQPWYWSYCPPIFYFSIRFVQSSLVQRMAYSSPSHYLNQCSSWTLETAIKIQTLKLQKYNCKDHVCNFSNFH